MTRLNLSSYTYFDSWDFIRQEAQKPNAYLLPVRIFLAVGWLRVCAEKITDPHWLTGQTLATFLTSHMTSGMPFVQYQSLAHSLFLPNAAALAALVLIGQLLVGLALLAGLFTPYALAGGLFMNLNFLLSGAADPSAFYVVLQLILLMGRAGDAFGLDGLRQQARDMQPKPWRPLSHRNTAKTARLVSVVCALISVVAAVIAFTSITHFEPAASVKDAAAVLCVLACVTLGLSLITYLRQPDNW